MPVSCAFRLVQRGAAAALLAVVCARVEGAAVASTGRPDRVLWTKAHAAHAALQASAARQKKSAEWDKVADAYRSVVHRYPQSPYCDDALLALGDLYRDRAHRFPKSRARYRTQSMDAYRSIVAEYPSSSKGDEALFKVFEIASETREPRAVREAAQAYLEAFPRGTNAQTVKTAVRKQGPAEARALPSPPPPGLAQVFGLRYWSGENSTRVVVQLEREVALKHERIDSPDRLWIDLSGARLHPNLLKTNRLPVGDVQLDGVRISQFEPKVVRVVLDFKKVKDHAVFYLQDPPRLVIDVRGDGPEKASTTVASGSTTGAEPFPTLAPGEASEPTATPPPAPRRTAAAAAPPQSQAPPPAPTAIVIVERPESTRPRPTPTPTAAPIRSADSERPAAASTPAPPRPNRDGSISIYRQLGLTARTIVIDAGHGGHDPGTIGPTGLEEKDLVLDVARRLAQRVEKELRAQVILTRSTDVFIPLEERTAIANSRGADLFLSIHANSSRNRSASGIETYFLSLARDRDAEELAMRENAISAATVKDLQGLLKEMLKGKVDESRDFATCVHEAMVSHLKPHNPLVHDRKVRTAPFYVLIGANMPSILAEIAFVSNPQEERLLKTDDYRDEIAASLLRGVKSYLDVLNRAPIPQLTAVSRRSKVNTSTRVLPPLTRERRRTSGPGRSSR